MTLEKQEDFQAGFVAVVGRPNVGKSTLINALVGQKIAAVSYKPQTTRQRQLGILTEDAFQIVFIDTPGLHIPVHKLGRAMNMVAQQALEEADGILWIIDLSQEICEEDHLIAQRLKAQRNLPALILALNKVDAVDAPTLQIRSQEYALLISAVEVVRISALYSTNLDDLKAVIFKHLPQGAPFYPPDQVTDYYERDIAADLIREAALQHLQQEVPHAIAVRIDQYKEREEKGALITATIFVEKESQKGIVIGKGGAMLKGIGIHARQAIEKMSGRKVFLELRVKVNKNWRNNENILRRMGFPALEKEQE